MFAILSSHFVIHVCYLITTFRNTCLLSYYHTLWSMFAILLPHFVIHIRHLITISQVIPSLTMHCLFSVHSYMGHASTWFSESVYICMCLHACVFFCVFVVYVCVLSRMQCVCVCMGTCTFMSICACDQCVKVRVHGLYAYRFLHICICIHKYTYMYMYLCVSVLNTCTCTHVP